MSIVFVWFLFLIMIILLSSNTIDLSFYSLEKFGILGDSLNILTSLFTGLAFAGVIVSIILQTRELEDARVEFKGQKEALYEQQNEMRQQSFDVKFFQMISLLNEIKKSLIIKANKQVYNSNEVFHFLRDKFEKDIESVYTKDTDNSIFNVKEAYFTNSFNNFNDNYDNTFKYYFINLYQIMKFIDEDTPNKNSAKKYMNILRAQLSKNELILLFYNALGVYENNGDKYKKLIEKYSFFEHLQYEDFCTNFKVIKINNELLLNYEFSAFGKNKSLINNIEN